MCGDIVKRKGRATHQLFRSIQPEAAENGLRIGFASLPEQPPQVTGRNVNRIGDLLDGGILREVLDVPGDRALDFKIREIRQRGRQAVELTAFQHQQCEFGQVALKEQWTDKVRLAKSGLEFLCDCMESQDVSFRKFLFQPAAILPHHFVQWIRNAPKMHRDAFVCLVAMAGPGVGTVGSEDPQGFLVESRSLLIGYK